MGRRVRHFARRRTEAFRILLIPTPSSPPSGVLVAIPQSIDRSCPRSIDDRETCQGRRRWWRRPNQTTARSGTASEERVSSDFGHTHTRTLRRRLLACSSLATSTRRSVCMCAGRHAIDDVATLIRPVFFKQWTQQHMPVPPPRKPRRGGGWHILAARVSAAAAGRPCLRRHTQ